MHQRRMKVAWLCPAQASPDGSGLPTRSALWEAVPDGVDLTICRFGGTEESRLEQLEPDLVVLDEWASPGGVGSSRRPGSLVRGRPFVTLEHGYGGASVAGSSAGARFRQQVWSSPLRRHTFFMAAEQREVHLQALAEVGIELAGASTGVLSTCLPQQALHQVERLNAAQGPRCAEFLIEATPAAGGGAVLALEEARRRGLPYRLLLVDEVPRALDLLRFCRGLIYAPDELRPCPPLVTLASLLGADLVVSDRVQQVGESWFLRGQTECLDYLRARPGYFWHAVTAAGRASTPARQGRPRRVMVVSHPRSGTHFLMNALALNAPLTATPWVDLDGHAFAINFYAPGAIVGAIASLPAEACPAIIKSHHPVEFLEGCFPDLHDAVDLVYIHREPAAVMASYRRHVADLPWAEGPRTESAREFLASPPVGALLRYQTRQHATMLERWEAHVRGWLAFAGKHPDWVTTVAYEDLAEDFDATVGWLCERLGHSLQGAPVRPEPTVNVISAGHLDGRTGEDLPRLDAVTVALPRREPTASRPGHRPGVTLVADLGPPHLDATEIAYQLLVGLSGQGMNVSLLATGQPVGDARTRHLYANAQARGNRIDFATPSLRVGRPIDMALSAGRGPRTGVVLLESREVDDTECAALACLDRILVPSRWAQRVLREAGVRVPVEVVPLGVDTETFHPRASLPEPSYTTFVHLDGSDAPHQLDILLAAFGRAFGPRDAVRLLLFAPHQGVAHPLGSKFRFLPVPSDRRALAGQLARADCAICLAPRAGWSHLALAALASGGHLIATDSPEKPDFLDESNARLVRPGGAAQGDPLAEHLRAVHRAKAAGGLTVNAAGIETAARLSWSAALGQIREHLRER